MILHFKTEFSFKPDALVGNKEAARILRDLATALEREDVYDAVSAACEYEGRVRQNGNTIGKWNLVPELEGS